MHMLLCIEKENDDDELDNHEDTIKLERRGGGEKKVAQIQRPYCQIVELKGPQAWNCS